MFYDKGALVGTKRRPGGTAGGGNSTSSSVTAADKTRQCISVMQPSENLSTIIYNYIYYNCMYIYCDLGYHYFRKSPYMIIYFCCFSATKNTMENDIHCQGETKKEFVAQKLVLDKAAEQWMGSWRARVTRAVWGVIKNVFLW